MRRAMSVPISGVVGTRFGIWLYVPCGWKKKSVWKFIRRRDEEYHAKLLYEIDWLAESLPECHPTYGEVAKEYSIKELQIRDPTTLILVDEADRLRMASLEQVRAIFDAGEISVILIGMPGLEKRLARYPQFYSRIGFVHEFRPLGIPEIRQLLEQYWTPPGVHLPAKPLDQESVAAIIRITGGNFRLLNRLLTQMERILEINALQGSDEGGCGSGSGKPGDRRSLRFAQSWTTEPLTGSGNIPSKKLVTPARRLFLSELACCLGSGHLCFGAIPNIAASSQRGLKLWKRGAALRGDREERLATDTTSL
jgi:hypothetical protein